MELPPDGHDVDGPCRRSRGNKLESTSQSAYQCNLSVQFLAQHLELKNLLKLPLDKSTELEIQCRLVDIYCSEMKKVVPIVNYGQLMGIGFLT